MGMGASAVPCSYHLGGGYCRPRTRLTLPGLRCRDAVGHRGEIAGFIALADALGIPSNPRAGGVSGRMIYVIFPGSGDELPKDADAIRSAAGAQFAAWDGMAQLAPFYP
jgi:hypothetical protein